MAKRFHTPRMRKVRATQNENVFSSTISVFPSPKIRNRDSELKIKGKGAET